ncbi:MAG: biopolymer transporter ExbD [Bacteroidales bacterium]|nr:biopolymer transporter ExbD [Bacteroidales bacterium]MBR0240567.1 biopolymer transporter ExbD [Bacteroidales bacterium]MBR0297504.1 biopolymer transporter ExbD [Bacteroidales bacterium]
MSKFGGSNSKKEVPAVTSSSLSDIVFMLLFFFMVTTQLRETENKVQIKLPEATEVVKLERKDLASYVNIGPPTRALQATFGTEARIQLNDSFKTIEDIRDFIAAEREAKSEGDRPLMTTVIKADSDVRMGIITDVKQELRRCSALRILYQSRKAE